MIKYQIKRETESYFTQTPLGEDSIWCLGRGNGRFDASSIFEGEFGGIISVEVYMVEGSSHQGSLFFMTIGLREDFNYG